PNKDQQLAPSALGSNAHSQVLLPEATNISDSMCSEGQTQSNTFGWSGFPRPQTASRAANSPPRSAVPPAPVEGAVGVPPIPSAVRRPVLPAPQFAPPPPPPSPLRSPVRDPGPPAYPVPLKSAGPPTETGSMKKGGALCSSDAEALRDFSHHWRLDDNTQKYLAGLPSNVQSAVISGFKASQSTHCVSALLHGYARAIAQKLAPSLTDWDLNVFVKLWCLDQETQQYLEELPKSLAREVIIGFHPKEGTPNLGNQVRRFTQSIADNMGIRLPLGPGTAAAARRFSAAAVTAACSVDAVGATRSHPPERSASPEEQLCAFAERWQLTEATQQSIRTLPSDLRQQVVTGFQPKPGTRNVEALLHGYARSIQSRMGKAPFPSGLPGVSIVSAPPADSAPPSEVRVFFLIRGRSLCEGITATGTDSKPSWKAPPSAAPFLAGFAKAAKATAAEKPKALPKVKSSQGFGFALLRDGDSSSGEEEEDDTDEVNDKDLQAVSTRVDEPPSPRTPSKICPGVVKQRPLQSQKLKQQKQEQQHPAAVSTAAESKSAKGNAKDAKETKRLPRQDRHEVILQAVLPPPQLQAEGLATISSRAGGDSDTGSVDVGWCCQAHALVWAPAGSDHKAVYLGFPVHCRGQNRSALVIMPPVEVWDGIQSVRQTNDKSFYRWMPHINLLYPFYEDVGDLFEEAAREMEIALEGIQPFNLSLAHLSYFEHGKRSCTVWLDPAVDKEAFMLQAGASLAALQSDLVGAFPDCTDLSSDE
ncbi:unnamed protein product, partial [Polarella glacialis]